MEQKFWKGKRVFVSGHTGFKGGWLSLWLERLGSKVTGYALPPDGETNLFLKADVAEHMHSSVFGDIRDLPSLRTALKQSDPEVIFHLAAQPLVRRSYLDPVETYTSNVIGTVHLLEAARSLKNLKSVVVITTDKVYRDLQSPWPHREIDELGGYDPYSASKAACEIVAQSYRSAFFQEHGISLATARAGNVIGGGDWAQDRLLPDIVRAWQMKRPIEIRRPGAIRPWQHVLEPLLGYLTLAEHIWDAPHKGEPFNFGPHRTDAASVGQVLSLVKKHFPDLQVNCHEMTTGPHETSHLLLDNTKAEMALAVRPVWNLKQAIDQTMQWYKEVYSGKDAFVCCLSDIDNYEQVATSMVSK